MAGKAQDVKKEMPQCSDFACEQKDGDLIECEGCEVRFHKKCAFTRDYKKVMAGHCDYCVLSDVKSHQYTGFSWEHHLASDSDDVNAHDSDSKDSVDHRAHDSDESEDIFARRPAGRGKCASVESSAARKDESLKDSVIVIDSDNEQEMQESPCKQENSGRPTRVGTFVELVQSCGIRAEKRVQKY